jgi:hypothetical protein
MEQTRQPGSKGPLQGENASCQDRKDDEAQLRSLAATSTEAGYWFRSPAVDCKDDIEVTKSHGDAISQPGGRGPYGLVTRKALGFKESPMRAIPHALQGRLRILNSFLRWANTRFRLIWSKNLIPILSGRNFQKVVSGPRFPPSPS